MKQRFAIYLAGNIQKGHENESKVFWAEEDKSYLTQALNSVDLTFLNPAMRTDNLSDQKSVFGRDMMQVFCSDLILVDARERRGLGVGAEMMWAKINKTPVLTLAPKESHYRKSSIRLLGVDVTNWIHPFVESLSDCVISNFQEGAEWIKAYLKGEIAPIKGSEFLHETMQHYKSHQFEHDYPMKEIAESCETLKTRIVRASSLSKEF